HREASLCNFEAMPHELGGGASEESKSLHNKAEPYRSVPPQSRQQLAALLSGRDIASSRFDDQFALRFLKRRRDVDLQLARRAVTFLIRRDKGQIVATAEVVHQRLKGRVEI